MALDAANGRMSFLDMLMTTLGEHEKQISQLEDRLETLINAFDDLLTEMTQRYEIRKYKPSRIRRTTRKGSQKAKA